MTRLTIFTAPKPFTNPHIAMIQRNAIQSWLQLGPEVDVLLIGEEDGISAVAKDLGVVHLRGVKRNASGTPLVSSMFTLAREHGCGDLLACVNTDIIFMPGLLEVIDSAAHQARQFLMVGQRWDLDIRQPMDYCVGWEGQIEQWLAEKGHLHPRGGSDYFIFPRTCFVSMPDFAIGRAGWDNWMIYEARRQGWPTIDATADLRTIHQDHDYSHLPNGQPHYRLPETAENVRLAGGHRTIFNLIDTDKRLLNRKLIQQELTWKKFWREVEIFPLVRLHSMFLGQAAYALFHPLKAYRELRASLRK